MAIVNERMIEVIKSFFLKVFFAPGLTNSKQRFLYRNSGVRIKNLAG